MSPNNQSVTRAQAKHILKNDTPFENELLFIHRQVFNYFIRDWASSIIQYMTERRESNVNP